MAVNLMRIFIFFALSLSGALCLLADEAIRFNRDIRPILSENCFACHGFDRNKRKADLRLDVFIESLLSDEILMPGAPEKSALYQRITATNHDDRMPPPESGKAFATRSQSISVRPSPCAF